MTDNFLSNNGYYNKGGLNGKPKEPRPISPKGQSPDDKYKLIFRQLIHERNELRKYIIDICELLDINTSQSVLGANCLEFYAVLSSVAKDKMKDLQEQLKRKEEEVKELNLVNKKLGAELCGKLQNYMRVFDEIKEIAEKQCNICEALTPIDEYKDCKKCWQGVILQKISEEEK